MRIAIVGSRSITDDGVVRRVIADALKFLKLKKDTPLTILSGGAKGVDSLVQQWAQDVGHDFILFKPYHLLDKRAIYEAKYFFVRNKQMVDNADAVIVIWDEESSGCFDAARYALKSSTPVVVWSTKKNGWFDLSSSR